MGYTHYWYTKKNLDPNKFSLFSNDVKKLVESEIDVETDLKEIDVKIKLKEPNNVLCFESDKPDEKPLITSEQIRFNGKEDDGHETFLFVKDSTEKEENGFVFDFCKTARKPYDLYVVACLILAKKYFESDIKISSDGEIEDWQDGKKLIESTFNYSVDLDEVLFREE